MYCIFCESNWSNLCNRFCNLFIEIVRHIRIKCLSIFYVMTLIQAIDATRGWLITYGNNQGIAKVVGDAVRDGQAMRLRRGIDDKIVCIGIVAWGNIMHNEMLTFNNPPETVLQ